MRAAAHARQQQQPPAQQLPVQHQTQLQPQTQLQMLQKPKEESPLRHHQTDSKPDVKPQTASDHTAELYPVPDSTTTSCKAPASASTKQEAVAGPAASNGTSMFSGIPPATESSAPASAGLAGSSTCGSGGTSASGGSAGGGSAPAAMSPSLNPTLPGTRARRPVQQRVAQQPRQLSDTTFRDVKIMLRAGPAVLPQGAQRPNTQFRPLPISTAEALRRSQKAAPHLQY